MLMFTGCPLVTGLLGVVTGVAVVLGLKKAGSAETVPWCVVLK
jgi:hypothetical protein